MMTSLLMVVSALGLIIIGVIPGVEELWRIFIYLLISIFYISFWLGLAILFSILFRSVATSALAAIAAWVFFSFFISLGANAVASAITPDASESNPDSLIQRSQINKAISLISPLELYTDSTATIIDPMKKTTSSIVQLGMMEQISMARFSGPLPLSQSILVVMPYIISLMAITVICFGISYAVFMRQEIRSI
jgi:ABC-2 type transport system permease protein